jgi:hypothetical protein
MSAAGSLVRYDAMCTAIAECHRVDEAKDIHDKALALEVYARQSKNTEAERKACDIRIRAERRCGELLKELARDQGGKGLSNGETTLSPYASALESTGLSRQTASRYQALADVPRETFEEAISGAPRKPSTTAIIESARDPQPKLDDDALWVWGRLRDLERRGLFAKTPDSLLVGMTDTMRADVTRLAPMAAEFFASFEREIA